MESVNNAFSYGRYEDSSELLPQDAALLQGEVWVIEPASLLLPLGFSAGDMNG